MTSRRTGCWEQMTALEAGCNVQRLRGSMKYWSCKQHFGTGIHLLPLILNDYQEMSATQKKKKLGETETFKCVDGEAIESDIYERRYTYLILTY